MQKGPKLLQFPKMQKKRNFFATEPEHSFVVVLDYEKYSPCSPARRYTVDETHVDSVLFTGFVLKGPKLLHFFMAIHETLYWKQKKNCRIFLLII